MTDMEYDGWPNKPTWCVSMYIDGNYTGEGTCRFYESLREEFLASPSPKGDVPEFRFADILRHAVVENIDDNDELTSGLVGDLLEWALAYVDWQHLAKVYLDA